MRNIPTNKMIKEFEEWKNIYFKLGDSLKALASLIKLSSDQSFEVNNNHELIDFLMEKIMQGGDDPHLYIPYKGDSIDPVVLREYEDLYNKIRKDYEILGDSKLEELEPDIPLESFDIATIAKGYNLVDILISFGKENWIKELLLTGMPSHQFFALLRDITDDKRKLYGASILRELDKDLIRNKTKKELRYKIDERRHCLNGSSYASNIADYDMDIMYYMQKVGLCDYAAFLRKNFGIKDIFSNIFKADDIRSRTAMAIEYINKEDGRNARYYKSELFLEIVPYLDIMDIYTVIKGTNLPIDYLYDFCAIGEGIIEKWDKVYDNPTTRPNLYKLIDSDIKECNKMLIKMIKDSKSKEDYKVRKRFSKEILSVVNKENAIARYKQKDKDALLKEQELSTKRKEISTLLYNLNEKLQAEVPGKRKIKEIDFKNLS